MSESYVASKLREALVAADGNRARAQRILLTWLQTDDRLLRALAAPFMKAIVTAAIDRADRAERAARRPALAAPSRRELSPEALDQVLAQMARRQEVRRPTPNAPLPGPENPIEQRLGTLDAPPPTQAGERHVKTMKALAAFYKRRRDF